MLIIAALLLMFAVFAGISAAPWVPTRKRDVSALLDDCELEPGDKFVELGCGDGRLLAEAAKRGAKAVGYEINPLLWLVATVRNIARLSKVRVRLGSLWRADISNADVVMLFLMPKAMTRLERKISSEMKPGSRLVCYIFGLPGRRPSIKRKKWSIYKL